MSAANIQAGIEIRANVEGAENIKTLADEIQAAGLDTSNLAAEAQRLGEVFSRNQHQQALIAQYKALSKELDETGTAMKAADSILDDLHESMKNGATAEQKEMVAKLRAEMENLAKKETELAAKVRDSRNAMTASGIAVKDLAETERRLAVESADAAREMDKLAAEAAELKAIADARIQLGLDADDKARQEIEKTKQAYETLKNSGTLSHEELARASELQRQKVEELERGLQKVKPTLADVAGGIQGIVTKAGGLAYATREAMKFESAMAGVKKVVDGTPEEIAGLSNEIKKMSRELGIMPDQLAEIAAQGGQLGIALERLPEFTEMAAKMSVAFGMSAQEAGDAAATIANVFQLPINEVSRLGDAINVLGNNTAAREKDIVNAMARIGGTANQFGLAAEEAAALADAFIALGKPPEVAATAINALLQKLQTAQSQGKDFQTALGQIGLSADEMAANIAANPQRALSDFLKKLEALDKQSRALVLSDLFGAQYSDDIALIVGSLGEYEKALALVADKSKVAGAMQAEFAAANETAQRQIELAKSSIVSAAITIGETLLPAVAGVAKGAGAVADAVGKVAEEFPVLTQLAVMYAGLRVGMQALETITKLTGAASVKSMLQGEVGARKFKLELQGAKNAAAALNVELGKADARKFKVLQDAAGGLQNKMMGVVQAVGMLGAAGTLGYGFGTWLRETFEPVQAIGDELGRVLAYVDAVFTDRTFEDVGRHYKTQAEAARELAAAEKQRTEAQAAQAAADAEAAAKETARITAIQGQYRELKAEYDAITASMKLMQAEGLAAGDGYALLGEKAESLRGQMELLNDELKKSQADFKFDTGAIAEAKNALADLGLTAEQVAGGISTEAAKGLEAFDKAAGQFGNSSDEMARIFQAALSKMDSPEAVEALKKRLAEVGKRAGLTAEEIEKIGDKAPTAADKVSEAFAKIGVDVESVKNGISSKAKEAFGDWQAASAAARENGIEDARLIRAGFEQMMGKLESRAEFEAFRKQLEKNGDAASLTKEQLERLNAAAKDGAGAAKTAYDAMAASIKNAVAATDLSAISEQARAAFQNGTLSAAEYDKVIGQVQQRISELETQSKKAGEAAAAAHKKASAEADKHAVSASRVAAANKELEKSTEAVAAAGEKAARKATALHQGLSDVHGVVKLTREEFVRYNNAIEQFRKGNTWFLSDGWKAYSENFLNAIKDAQNAQEALNGAVSKGTVNMAVLSRASNAAAAAAGKLDETSLKNLRNSIEAARQKLVELKNEATDARLSIEAELAALNGDEEKGHALTQQKKLAELRAKQQQAAQHGQGDVAGEWERAIKAQEQLYAKEKQQRAQRKAEEARQAQEAAANKNKGGLNLGDIGNVDFSALNGAAKGVVEQLQTALNGRDSRIVNQAGAVLLQQLQDGIKRTV